MIAFEFVIYYILLISLSKAWWSKSDNYDSENEDYSMKETINELKQDLRNEYDASGDYGKSKPLLSQVVRLSFHDCVGPLEAGDYGNGNGNAICNGCINFDAGYNKGVTDTVEALEDIYSAYDDKMSRADFYAAAGTIALEYAQELDEEYDDRLPEISLYFGRKDCDYSPKGEEIIVFPGGSQGWKNTFEFINNKTDMDEEETIAILGAHTLGEAHEYYSGFGTKSWVNDPYALNNYYYKRMISDSWYQNEVNCESSPSGCKWEWNDELDEHLMLNVDISMFWDIDPNENGEVYCDLDSCPQQDDYIRDIVESYADDNQLWLNAFVHAWDIMVTNGYDKDELQVYRL